MAPQEAVRRFVLGLQKEVKGPVALFVHGDDDTPTLAASAAVTRAEKAEIAAFANGARPKPPTGWRVERLKRGRSPVGLLMLKLPRGKRRAPAAALREAALIAENAQLRARLRQRAATPRLEEQQAILAAGRALASSLTLEDLFSRVVSEAQRVFSIDNVYVALIDPADDVIRFPLFIEDGQPVEHRARKPANGLTELVLRTNAPVLISRDFSDNLTRLGVSMSGRHARSWLGVPLTVHGRPIGVLGLYDPHREGVFEERHVPIASALAAQLGVAVQNADLFRLLSDSEARYRAVAEAATSMRVGLAIVTEARSELRAVYANDVVCDITGTDLRAVLDQPILSFLSEEEIPRLLDYTKQWRKGHAPAIFIETTIVRADGVHVPVECGVGPARIRGRLHAVLFLRDITDRKKAEDDLKETLSLLSATLEATADGILVVDRATRKITSFNRKFAEMWRFPPDMLRSWDDNQALDFVLDQILEPEAFIKQVEELYSDADAESSDVIDFKDGRVFERHSRPQRIGGRVIGRVWSFHDVTPHRQAERAAQESEAKWRSLVENAPNVIQALDRDYRITFLNRVVPGFDKDAVIGTSVWDYIPPHEHARIRAIYDRVFETGEATTYELEAAGPNGALAWYRTSVGPVLRDGKVGSIMLISTDVTDQKRAEDALRRQTTLYETLLTAQSDLGEGFLIAENERIVYVNDAMAAMSGHDREEILGFKSFLDAIVPEERERVSERLGRDLIGETVEERYETAILHKDGHRVDVEAAVKVLRQDDKAQVIAIVRDITQRKEHERELADLTRQYRTVVETAGKAGEGLAVMEDVDGRVGVYTFVNDEYARILGHRVEDLLGRSFTEGIIAPEDARRVLELYEQRKRGEPVPVSYETTLVRKDGGRASVEVSASTTQAGGRTLTVAFVRDITERKAAEAKLMQLKNLHQEMVENVPAGVLYLDANGLITFENRYLLRLMGASEDDTPKGWFTTIFDLPTLSGQPEFLDKVRGMLRGEPFRDFEFSYRSLYGRDVTITVAGVPIFETAGAARATDATPPADANAQVKGGILLIRDATEEHQLAKQLAEYAQELERKVEERTQELREANQAIAKVNLTLQTIYEATIDGFLFVDKDRNFVSANNRFCELFGYTMEELLHGEPGQVRAKGRANMKDPSYFDLTLQLYEPDKRHLSYDGEVDLMGPLPRRVHEHSEPIFGPDGEYIGRVWTYRDVTEQRMLQEALAERTQLLSTILENTTDGVFALDASGEYLFCNRRHAELMGFEEDNVVHRPLFHAFPESRAVEYAEALSTALKGERELTVELSFVNRQGRALHLLWNVTPLVVEGQLQQIVGTVTDLTERKRLEEELILYTQHLEDEVDKRTNNLLQAAKMAALGQLIAGVAHEINNPLAYVKSNTETLREVAREIREHPDIVKVAQGDVTRVASALAWLRESDNLAFLIDKAPQLLDMNVRGLMRISDIVHRLKSYAAPQPMRQERMEVRELLKDTADIYRAQFRDKIEFVEEYAPDLPKVRCDPGQINQVIMNLLVNAAQAIPGNGRVKLSARREGRHVAIEVEDNGAGMPPEVKARIFDPFFTTKDKGNTGLGLSISYSIVKEHGGDVSVRSAPGVGTTFTVRIPLEEVG